MKNMDDTNDKYSNAFGLAAFVITLGFTALFMVGALVAVFLKMTALAGALGSVGFGGMLGCIPLILLLVLIGELADDRAATNDHRIALAWMRNHRTITAFFLVPID